MLARLGVGSTTWRWRTSRRCSAIPEAEPDQLAVDPLYLQLSLSAAIPKDYLSRLCEQQAKKTPSSSRRRVRICRPYRPQRRRLPPRSPATPDAETRAPSFWDPQPRRRLRNPWCTRPRLGLDRRSDDQPDGREVRRRRATAPRLPRARSLGSACVLRSSTRECPKARTADPSRLGRHPLRLLRHLVTCGAGFNHGWFCDRRADRANLHASSLNSTNPRAAAGVWAALDRRLVDEAACVPMIDERGVDFVSARVRNYQFHPYWGLIADQLWLR
jgi:hypothetical protein